ncbi:MAG: SBBP repeat-containing protein [Bacteroidota bacterium]
MKNLQRILFCAVLLLSFISFKSFAQAPEWEWAKSAGGNRRDCGNSIATDNEGNVYVTGYFNSSSITFENVTLNSSNQDNNGTFFLVKYDKKGNVLWVKSAIDNNLGSRSNSVITDADRNIYITGTFYGASITFGGITIQNFNSNTSDIFVVKYDTDGNALWAKSAGGLGGDEGSSITVDSNRNVYITGFFHTYPITIGTTTLSNSGDADIFIAKYDSNGNFIWAQSAGGEKHESGNAIITDSSGNIYVAGTFSNTFINFATDTIFNNTPGGSMDIFVAKFNSKGTVLWTKSIGGYANDNTAGIGIDNSNNFYITGYFSNTFITIENDTLFNAGKEDIFIVKYDVDGNKIWAQSTGGTESDVGSDITFDNEGNVYLGGWFSSKIIFGNIELNNTKFGSSDLFIVKYDTQGKVLWAKSVGGNSFEGLGDIELDTSSNIYITGIFDSPIINFGKYSLSSEGPSNMIGSGNVFIAKLGTSITDITELHNESVPNIFPNPTASQFHIANLEPGNWTITIYTLDGQSVFKKELTEADAMIDLSGKAKGAYVYRLLKDGEVFKSGKLLLE